MGNSESIAFCTQYAVSYPPSPRAFASIALSKFVVLLLKVFLLVNAIRRSDYYLAISTALAILLASVFTTINTWVELGTYATVDRKERKTKTFAALFQVTDLIEAYAYIHGVVPRMYSHVSRSLDTITLSGFGSVLGSVYTILTDRNLDFSLNTFSMCALPVSTIFNAVNYTWMSHLLYGSPTNFQKWRLVDFSVNGSFHITCVRLIDLSMVTSRLLLAPLIAVSSGTSVGCLLFLAYYIPAFVLFSISLHAFKSHAFRSYTWNLCVFPGALKWMIYDYGWLEPSPSCSFACQYGHPFRMLQYFVAALLIASNWKKYERCNQLAFWIIFGIFFTAVVVNATLFPWYRWVLLGKENDDSIDRRDLFNAQFILAQRGLHGRFSSSSAGSAKPKLSSMTVVTLEEAEGLDQESRASQTTSPDTSQKKDMEHLQDRTSVGEDANHFIRQSELSVANTGSQSQHRLQDEIKRLLGTIEELKNQARRNEVERKEHTWLKPDGQTINGKCVWL